MKGDGKHIIRGGYGIYYDFPYTNATSLFPAASVQSDYRAIYSFEDVNGIKNADGSFFRPGQPLPPNQGGSGPGLPGNIALRSWEAPQSTQISLGYSWEVNNSLGLNFEAVHIDYDNIPFRFRANPVIDGTRILGAGTAGSIRAWAGDGSAEYKGFNIGFHARSRLFEAQGFYTWSEADGNVLVGADEFRLWDGGSQPDAVRDTPVNPIDPYSSENFGPLFTDARHRVTLSTLYHAPLGINVAGILRYRSALPFTKFDTSATHFGYGNVLAAGVSHVNTERADSFSQIDLRVSREFRFGSNMGIELIGEIFNLLNSKNGTRFALNPATGQYEPTIFAGDTGQGEQRLAQLGARLRF
jgi:hypothetical protein